MAATSAQESPFRDHFRSTEWPLLRLTEELFEATGGGGRVAEDLVPCESSNQPAGGGYHGCLSACVMDRLIEVMLAVELDEDAELGPGEVDEGDEFAVLIKYLHLSDRLRRAGDPTPQLDEEGLQQASGRSGSWRPKCENPPNPA